MRNLINKINRYIINDKAVIVFWDTGEKTIAKIDDNDIFDKETGFMIAFSKYLYLLANARPYSKTEYKKIMSTIKDDKLKDYLFVIFNKYTFEDTNKAKKYLENLKEGGK